MGHLFTERKGILHGPQGSWHRNPEADTGVIPSDRRLSFWHMDAVRLLHCLKSPHPLLDQYLDQLCEVLPFPQIPAETLPPR